MNEAELLWKIIAILAICGNLFVIARKLFGKSEEYRLANNPLLVQEHQEYVSRRECSIHHQAFGLRLTTLEKRFNSYQSEIKEEIGDLHEKMNAHQAEIMRALGRLEGK